METDKELSKKARPGELTIRGSMEPEVILPPGRARAEAKKKDEAKKA